MWTLLIALAAAQDLARAGQPLSEGHYARLDDDGVRATALWPRRTPNTYRVYQYPDGAVQRALVFERSRLKEERLYDVRGFRSVTIRWRDNTPTDATVHLAAPLTLAMDGWSAQALGGATLWLPTPPGADGAVVAGGSLRAWSEPAADVTSQAWLDARLAACGCALIERHADWLDGQPGVRLRLRAEGPSGAEEALLWAAPRGDQTALFSFTAAAGADPDAALAPGRAVVGALRWSPAP